MALPRAALPPPTSQPRAARCWPCWRISRATSSTDLGATLTSFPREVQSGLEFGTRKDYKYEGVTVSVGAGSDDPQMGIGLAKLHQISVRPKTAVAQNAEAPHPS